MEFAALFRRARPHLPAFSCRFHCVKYQMKSFFARKKQIPPAAEP